MGLCSIATAWVPSSSWNCQVLLAIQHPSPHYITTSPASLASFRRNYKGGVGPRIAYFSPRKRVVHAGRLSSRVSWAVAYWWRSGHPEIGLQEVEVQCVDDAVIVEVGSPIVARITHRLSECKLGDAKVYNINYVIVVG